MRIIIGEERAFKLKNAKFRKLVFYTPSFGIDLDLLSYVSNTHPRKKSSGSK
jgi:hypothetical protein